MRLLWSCALLAVPLLAVPAAAEGPAQPTSYEVPYRLTVPKHIHIRAKINGKGPFNFILDTGAPALFLSSKVAAKLGVKPDKAGWGTFDRFEIEGGVVLNKVQGKIDDLFQLEGMNGLGLAGCELHGVIGYDVLARFRLEIDFTRDKMVWTPLDYKHPEPLGMGKRGASAGGGLESMGTILKWAGTMLGRKAEVETAPRGFLGLELSEKDEVITVVSVLDGGPAAKGGVKVGDRILKFKGRTVISIEDVEREALKYTPGKAVTLTVEREGRKLELNLTTGEGL